MLSCPIDLLTLSLPHYFANLTLVNNKSIQLTFWKEDSGLMFFCAKHAEEIVIE